MIKPSHMPQPGEAPSLIRLRVDGDGWVAHFVSGPERDRVVALFEADTLPLPFLKEARASLVLATLQHTNRDHPFTYEVENAAGEKSDPTQMKS